MEAKMFECKYIAHALGGYCGYKYLNNEPALKNAIKNGHRYFEVDLTLTEDGHVMPSHGWTEDDCRRSGMPYSEEFAHMTRELFLRQKVHDMPTMDIETLYGYMKKYKRFHWQLDLHTLPKDEAARVTCAVLGDFHHDEELLSRILVQANSPEMFEGIESVYHFSYYQMFVKRGTSLTELEELLDYCKRNGFVSVAISAKDVNDEYIRLIKNYGLYILVYSLDDQKKADRLINAGVDTICTNKLSPRADRERHRRERTPRKIAGRLKRKLRKYLIKIRSKTWE